MMGMELHGIRAHPDLSRVRRIFTPVKCKVFKGALC